MRDLFLQADVDDSAVGGALRIIDYFDRLVSVHADTETLVREAAALAGVPVGCRQGDVIWRSLPSGMLTEQDASADTVEERRIDDHCLVWREGGPGESAHGKLVLERLGLALEISQASRPGDTRVDPVETLFSAPLKGERPDLRERAWSRLRMEPTGMFRALAVPIAQSPAAALPHALIDTADGPLFGVIVRDGGSWSGTAGVGLPTSPAELHRSWRSALLALRLSERDQPFYADDLGSLLPMLEAVTLSTSDSGDADAVEKALKKGWSLAGLQALADGKSIRSIARTTGLHHSTIQARVDRISDVLGFDPTTSLGSTRLGVALLLWRWRLPVEGGRAG